MAQTKRKNAKQIIALLYKQWKESCEKDTELYRKYEKRSEAYGDADILTQLAYSDWKRQSGMCNAYQNVFDALGLEIYDLVKISHEVEEGK